MLLKPINKLLRYLYRLIGYQVMLSNTNDLFGIIRRTHLLRLQGIQQRCCKVCWGYSKETCKSAEDTTRIILGQQLIKQGYCLVCRGYNKLTA